ncbi:hypothetical protein [Citrobacter portucalensis]|uniref:hypothetical protein n=1 Tax=Citrobacter portucalensis TaxID=1639133 RepID=UPI000C22CBE1|nr:hypothetical protein [Citrobacter portucalensis]ATX92611.1 hypothetical protein AM348_13795 [Citrobacter freundii]AVD78992.1 hypothetical protein AM350_15640 [Citrobacter freundii]
MSKLKLALLVIAATTSLTNTFGAIITWICLPLLIIFFGLIGKKKFNIRAIIMALIIIFFITASSYFAYSYAEYNSRFIINYLLSVVGFITVAIGFNKLDFIYLSRLIKIVLLAHCILFLMQFLSYYVFKYNLDYNLLTGGPGSRHEWGELYRTTGIYDEPAVFAMHISTLIVMKYIIKKKTDAVDRIALLCLVLSFSFVGIFQAFLIGYLVFRGPAKKILFSLGCMAFILFFIDNIILRYNEFIAGGDGSNNTKIETINHFLNSSDKLFFGYGLAGYDASFPLYYQGLYDLTFWGANFTLWGVVIGSLLTSYFLWKLSLFKFKEIILINVCLIKIATPTFMIYWFFIIFIYLYSKKRMHNVSTCINSYGNQQGQPFLKTGC